MTDETGQAIPPAEPIQETPQATEPVASTPTTSTPEPSPPPQEPVAIVEQPSPPPTQKSAAQPTTVETPRPSQGAHMRQVVQAKKRARLEKIVALAVDMRVISNDDVEKLLKVSDATATRYLSELVKSGRLKRSGPIHHERYEPQ